MNVKEISKAVNKSERTVHNWIKKTSAKIAQVSAKIAQAQKDSIAADYNLEEYEKLLRTLYLSGVSK